MTPDAQAKRIVELELALRRMERFAAVVLLEWFDQEGPRFPLEDMPAPVAALVTEHEDSKLGTCDNCGVRGPLKKLLDPQGHVGGNVCAWGCCA